MMESVGFLFPPPETGRVVATQVAFMRLGQIKVSNSDKSEFGGDRVGVTVRGMIPTRLAIARRRRAYARFWFADLPLAGGGKEFA